jgi:hypothetical protein
MGLMHMRAFIFWMMWLVAGGAATAQSAASPAPQSFGIAPCPEYGYFRNCHGSYTWYDGSIYEGTWKDNQKTGMAVYNDANGDTYVGEWKSNRRSGEGVYIWRDGRVWLGQWKDGEPHGRFIQYAPDKSIERMGVFHKGRLQSAKPVDPKMFTRIAGQVLAATRVAPVVPAVYPPPLVQKPVPAAAATAMDAFPIDDVSWDARYPAP